MYERIADRNLRRGKNKFFKASIITKRRLLKLFFNRVARLRDSKVFFFMNGISRRVQLYILCLLHSLLSCPFSGEPLDYALSSLYPARAFTSTRFDDSLRRRRSRW